MLNKTAWIFAILILSLPSFAAKHSFQLGGVSAWQDSGHSFGGVVRYSPAYEHSESLELGISLDASVLKLDTNTNFTALGLMAFAKYKLSDRWELQGNIGTQNWSCSGCKTSLVAGPSAIYNLEGAAKIKNIWAAYLPVFHEKVAHSLQLGFGTEF